MRNAKTCILSMTKNDYFQYGKWFDYYSRHIAPEDMYLLNNNSDAAFMAQVDPRISVMRVPDAYRTNNNLRDTHQLNDNFDGCRALLISDLTNGLLNYYDIVLYTDIDELIVPDPAVYGDLSGYLNQLDRSQVRCPVGVNVTHMPQLEPNAFNPDDLITNQRAYVGLAVEYSKPVIKTKRYQWCGGFHGCDAAFSLDRDLYLFHLKACDVGIRRTIHQQRHAEYNAHGKGDKTGWKLPADIIMARMSANLEKALFREGEGALKSALEHIRIARGNLGYYRAVYEPPTPLNGSWELFEIPERFRGLF